MAIKIDARELTEVLSLTPPSQNILLVGKHGIGKSQIIRKYFAALLENPMFGKVSGWVLVDSPVAVQVLETFIRGIKL